MATQTKRQVALFSVWWATVAIFGALWASKGHLLGWASVAAGLSMVYLSHQIPKLVGGKWITFFLVVVIAVNIFIILDLAGVPAV